MQISATGFKLTPPIRQRVESRLQKVTESCGMAGTGATVRLLDTNGDRGGVDKQCRVSLPLRAAKPLLAEVTDRDLYRAVDRAALQLQQQLRRRRARHRTLSRYGAPSPRPAA